MPQAELNLILPAVTAALTLANTVVLWLIKRKNDRIEAHTNGMQLQLLAEAEKRGARLERRRVEDPPIGQ